MVKHTTDIDLATFKPLEGFIWIRQSLPLQTIARGEGNTATKLARIAHAGLLQSGTDHMWQWRCQTRHFLSDQGAELGIPVCPFGSRGEIHHVLNALRTGNLEIFSEDTRNIVFLPNALTQRGLLHVGFNALQEAFEHVPEFIRYKEGLKSLAKICGEASYKERLLEKCFRYDLGASKAERHVIHAYAGQHVDWRWEHLEDVAGQMRWVYPLMKKYFDASYFSDEGSLLIKARCEYCDILIINSRMMYCGILIIKNIF